MVDLLEVREKRKANPLYVVSPDDFASAKLGEVDPAVVVSDPTVSLYCLDHAARRVWFVQVPEGTDITAAAFMYVAQYDYAQRLLAVPYDVLHRIAADMNLRDPLVFIYSTGRAGSTLVSKAFEEMGAVTSLSEPDVYTQAVALRSSGVPDDEIRDVLASATRILFNPTFTRGSTLNVVKFRSMCIQLGDLLFESFPQAGNLFLYRDLAPFIRSWGRALPFDDLPSEVRRDIMAVSAPLMPLLAEELRHRTDISGIERNCLSWLSVMQACDRLVRRGIPMLAVRYEDLAADPTHGLETIVRYLGLPTDQVQSALIAFGRDSQAGSPLSREEVAHRNVTIDDRQWELVRNRVRRYPLPDGVSSSSSVEVP
jgi:hypothetical protein